MAVDNPINQRAFPSSFRQFIFNVTETNLAKADCPEHGDNVYFERVRGNLFQCAHIEHHEQSVTISSTNKPVQLHDR